jgi:hypothetical protein
MLEGKELLNEALRQGITPTTPRRHEDPNWLERRKDYAKDVSAMRQARHTRCDVPLLMIARQYTTDCPDRLPSLAGLCLVCSICMATLVRWRDYPTTICERLFSDVAKKVALMQEQSCLNTHPDKRKGIGPNETISRLVLSSRHGYHEQTEQQVTQVKHVILHFDEYEAKPIESSDIKQLGE